MSQFELVTRFKPAGDQPEAIRQMIEGIEAGAESVLVELAGGRLDDVTAATVYEGVVSGDAWAAEVMKEMQRQSQAAVDRAA